jgi:hypothetical protein
MKRTLVSITFLALEEVTHAFSVSQCSPRAPSGPMVVRPPPSRKGSFLYHHEDPRGRSDSFGLQGGKGTEQPVSSTQLWISHDNDTDQDGRNDAAGAKKKLSTAGRVGGR